MAENKIGVEVQVDDTKARKQTEDFATQAKSLFSNAFGISINTIALNQGLELAKKAFEFAKKAIEVPIEIVVDAERIKTIETQFDILAKQSGVAGEALKEGLVRAAGGLATTTQLLEGASKAMLTLNGEVSRLPEVLALARTASKVNGQSITDNFDKLNIAIATGNQRMLRQLQIVIDVDKATRDFAHTNGGAAESLSQIGKQQAILNAVLEKGKSSFAGIKGDVAPVTIELQRMQTEITQAGERMKKIFSAIFSPFLKAIVHEVTNVASGFNHVLDRVFGSEVQQKKAELQDLNKEIHDLGKAMFDIKKAKGFIGDKDVEIKKLSDRFLEARTHAIDLQKQISDLTAPGANKKIEAAKLFDPEKAERDRLQIQQILIQSEQDRLNSNLEAARLNGDQAAIDQVYREQQILAETQYWQKVQQVQAEFRKLGQLGSEANNQDLVNLEQQKNNKISALQKQATQNLNEVQKITRAAVIGGMTNAFSQLGAALVKGKNAFQSFSKAIIGALGGLAIQMGSFFVAVGLGFTAAGAVLPAWAKAGAGTVAAGIGLIALGGALTALGADDGSDSASAGSGGTATAGSSDAGGSALPTLNNAKPERDTNVQVIVNGPILDRRESGLAIAEILQEHFNNNGTLIAGSA